MADSCNHTQVFTAEGVFLRMFGWSGPDYIVGVAINPNDMVYVSEMSNRRVSVFTSEGQLVTSLRELSRPFGLAVDTSGIACVSLTTVSSWIKILH